MQMPFLVGFGLLPKNTLYFVLRLTLINFNNDGCSSKQHGPSKSFTPFSWCDSFYVTATTKQTVFKEQKTFGGTQTTGERGQDVFSRKDFETLRDAECFWV